MKLNYTTVTENLHALETLWESLPDPTSSEAKNIDYRADELRAQLITILQNDISVTASNVDIAAAEKAITDANASLNAAKQNLANFANDLAGIANVIKVVDVAINAVAKILPYV